MPDILTKPTKTLREAAQALIAAEACNYDRDAMCSEGLFDRLREALRENGSPASENALERDSAQSSPIPANSVNDPETITISLPMLRATVLAAIDNGYYLIYHADETLANNQRLCLADEVVRRLRQLPARG